MNWPKSLEDVTKGVAHMAGNGHESKPIEYPFLTRCDRCHKVTQCRRITSDEKPLNPLYVCKGHTLDAHLPTPKPLLSLPIDF